MAAGVSPSPGMEEDRWERLAGVTALAVRYNANASDADDRRWR